MRSTFTRRTRGTIAALAALAISGLGLSSPAFAAGTSSQPATHNAILLNKGVTAPNVCANPVHNTLTLETGHTDIFNPVVNGDGISLVLKEDASKPGTGVFRNPNYVILGVREGAFQKQTAQFSEIGTSGYLLPANQDQNLVWPGWDSLMLANDAKYENPVSVRYVFDTVTGPGRAFVFGSGAFGELNPRLNTGGTQITDGSYVEQGFLAHEHVNWLFEKPGDYVFTVHAEVHAQDGNVYHSEQARYRWAVGDAAIAQAKETAAAESAVRCAGENGALDPAATAKEEEGLAAAQVVKAETAGTTETGQDGTNQSDAGKNDAANSAAPGTGTDTNNSQNNAGQQTGSPDATSGKDNAGNNAPAGDQGGAQSTAPDADQGGAQGDVTLSPVATGADSGSPEAPAAGGTAAGGGQEICLPTEVKKEVSKEEAEKVKAGGSQGATTADSGTTKLGDSHTIPANTHVHPNWIFTKPGTYKVHFTAAATLKSGEKVSTPVTLTFNVGGSGNANDGHFDLGATVKDGKLVPLVKDDRRQPAQWVDPASLTFGLGDKAKTKAPAGLEFIAPAGAEIYTISATQVAGVPWLGMNTMNSDFLSQTTGELHWTLQGVDGPGALAVFTSGNLGQTVGEHWFGGLAGKGDAQAPAGTTGQAPQNAKVSEENGKYYVTTIEGRTPSGEPCELDPAKRPGGKLSHTGADTTSATVLAGMFLFAGACAVISGNRSYRRRQA